MCLHLLHQIPVNPLKATPDELTIAKGDSKTFEISGGCPSYTVESDKASITATLSTDVVTVAVDQSSTAETGTITVTDAEDETVEVDITVTSA